MKNQKVYLIKVNGLVVSNTHSQLLYDFYSTDTLTLLYECSFYNIEDLYRFCIINRIDKCEVLSVNINPKIEVL